MEGEGMTESRIYKIAVEVEVIAESIDDAEDLLCDIFDRETIYGVGLSQCTEQDRGPDTDVCRVFDYDFPKMYDIGMYGGKFLPFHAGHAYCIDRMCEQCEHPHVILFYGGRDETDYGLGIFDPGERYERICKYVRENHPRAEVHMIDVSGCRDANGDEDWDMETPLVREILPRIDAVFTSEPSYDPYFKRAYPEATHMILDPGRKHFPVSGTEIRGMDAKEASQWIM